MKTKVQSVCVGGKISCTVEWNILHLQEHTERLSKERLIWKLHERMLRVKRIGEVPAWDKECKVKIRV